MPGILHHRGRSDRRPRGKLRIRQRPPIVRQADEPLSDEDLDEIRARMRPASLVIVEPDRLISAVSGPLARSLPVGTNVDRKLPFLTGIDAAGLPDGQALTLPNMRHAGDGNGAAVYQVTIDALGDTGRLAVLMEDRTDRAVLEQRVMQSRNELALAHRALAEAREQAVRANLLKDRILGLVAHDLRAPLASVVQALELIREADAVSDPVMARLVAEEVEACRQSIGLIEDLLDIARLQQGTIEPRIRETPLSDLFGGVLARFSGPARDKGISLSCDDPGGRTLMADPVLLGQVLVNLVGNAVKFCRGRDDITLGFDADRSCITVTDTGPGMSDEKVASLFELGENRSTRGSAGERGTGLGLPLSHQLAAATGFRLEVDSAPDAGTTFRLWMEPSAAEREGRD